MAQNRKPAARRQGQGSGTRDLGLVPIDGPAVEVPPPEKGWLKGTVVKWEAFWGSPLGRVAEVATDLPALSRLFGLYDEHERAVRAFRKKRFVEGSRRQPRLNPIAAYVSDLEGQIRQLEDRFGMTPKARLQLGIEFANAHRSLKDLNASFSDEAPEAEDPRLAVIDGSAS